MFFAKRVRGGSTNAKIAQLVEHDLAKVGVAGSSPVFRSESFLPRISPARSLQVR